MYAVIQTGGKQYKVEPGETVVVEKLPGDEGDPVEFDSVLLLADDENVAVGRPTIVGAKVTGQIVSQGRAPKLIVYKFQRRKNHRRKQGHRQEFTAVKIGDVQYPKG